MKDLTQLYKEWKIKHPESTKSFHKFAVQVSKLQSHHEHTRPRILWWQELRNDLNLINHKNR
jgi:hypothetical protein